MDCGTLRAVSEREKSPTVIEPQAVATADDPPVVARLVVEIRSDGSRTIARGALEDHANGEDVAVAIEAGSPADLLRELSRAVFKLPAMMRGERAPTKPRKSMASRVRRRIRRALPGLSSD